MGALHLLLPDQTQQVFDEQAVREMIRNGRLLPATTMYWQPGLPEWRPLAEWIEHTPPTASSFPLYRFWKDPTLLTILFAVSLGILILVDLTDVIGCFLQLNFLSNPPFSHEVAVENDTRQRIISWFYLFFFNLSALFYCFWIYRANKNSRAFGAQDLQFTPGWAVGSNFVPFVSLVAPYQAMREIWKISIRPEEWRQQKGTPLLVCWWISWLIVCLDGSLIFQITSRAKDLPSLIFLTKAGIVESLASVAATTCLLVIIISIYGRQKRLVELR